MDALWILFLIAFALIGLYKLCQLVGLGNGDVNPPRRAGHRSDPDRWTLGDGGGGGHHGGHGDSGGGCGGSS